MNILKTIHIDNSNLDLIEKLNKLEKAADYEAYKNSKDFGRCYNARRRYRRLLNKLADSKNATKHMVTSDGYYSAGNQNLIIGT